MAQSFAGKDQSEQIIALRKELTAAQTTIRELVDAVDIIHGRLVGLTMYLAATSEEIPVNYLMVIMGEAQKASPKALNPMSSYVPARAAADAISQIHLSAAEVKAKRPKG